MKNKRIGRFAAVLGVLGAVLVAASILYTVWNLHIGVSRVAQFWRMELAELEKPVRIVYFFLGGILMLAAGIMLSLRGKRR